MVKEEGSKFVAVMGLVSGTIAFLGAVTYLFTGEVSRDWPAVAGEVTASSVVTREDQDPERPAFSTTYYEPVVRYRYTVRGTAYEGSRLAFVVADSETAAGAQERLESFPIGATVTVHYDPDDHASAVLESGWDPALLLGMFGFGVLGYFFGFAEVATIRAFARGKKPRSRRRGKRHGSRGKKRKSKRKKR